MDKIWKSVQAKHEVKSSGSTRDARRDLALQGIRTLAAGFSFFHPTQAEQEFLVEQLVKSVENAGEKGPDSCVKDFLQYLCKEMSSWEHKQVQHIKIAQMLLQTLGKSEVMTDVSFSDENPFFLDVWGEFMLLRSCHNCIINSISENTSDEDLSCFRVYIQHLLSSCDSILAKCESEEDESLRRTYSSHFLIGALLPSLSAAMIDILDYPAIAKKCACISKTYSSIIQKLCTLHQAFGESSEIIGCGAMNGKWSVRSGEEEHYTMSITHTAESLQGKVITKQGKPDSTEMEGVITGLRLRMADGMGSDAASLDCRLSLDGRYFSGNLKDVTIKLRGGMDRIEGYYVGAHDNTKYQSHLLSVAMVSVLALSKLMSQMASGFEETFESTVRCSEGHIMVEQEGVPETYKSIRNATVKCDPCGKDNIERDPPHFYHCRRCKYDVCFRCSGISLSSITPKLSKKEEEEEGETSHWLEHRLLSSGLSRHIQARQLHAYSEDLNLGETIKTWKDQYDVAITTSIIDPNFESISLEFDLFACKQLPHSPLSRLGGENMQKARRSVILTCLRHTGLIETCKLKIDEHSRGDVTLGEPLLAVWRSGHLIVEQAIRANRAACQSMGEELVTRVVEFLRSKCTLLLELIEPRVTEYNEEEFADDLNDLLNFFYSTTINLEKVENRLLSSFSAAVLRISALKIVDELIIHSDFPFPLLAVLVGGVHNAFGLTYQSFLCSIAREKHNIHASSLQVIEFPLVGPRVVNDLRLSFHAIYQKLVRAIEQCQTTQREMQHLLLQLWIWKATKSDHEFIVKCGILNVLRKGCIAVYHSPRV